jgi:hypothetical protein
MTFEEKLAAYPLLLNTYGGSRELYEADCRKSAQDARDTYAKMHPESKQGAQK